MVNNKVLIVVDMQNDFIDGSLGSEEAQAIVPNVVKKIEDWDGYLIVLTADYHDENYLQTVEGKHLPVKHCIIGSDGYNLNKDVATALMKKVHEGCAVKTVHKITFGSYQIACEINKIPDQIDIVGLCTDICVISNALLLKAAFPESDIRVFSDCCAGTSESMNDKALDVMRMCHIEVTCNAANENN